MPTVCITGVTGQIGSYLTELFLKANYEVWGVIHNLDKPMPTYMEPLLSDSKLSLISGDITYVPFVNSLASKCPDFFINCAAQSNVVSSFDNAEYTMKATGNAVSSCLQAIQQYSPFTRFITLGSALMFGSSPAPQNEISPLDPQSPYAQAKFIGYQATIAYRKTGVFACNAICFNSESPRRSEEYVFRKITKGAARIKYGLQKTLTLGNLQSCRDFSHAQDTAEAIYKIITHHQADDFVVASGQTHSIQELVELAFEYCDLNWKDYVLIDPKFLRNTTENTLCGNITKIQTHLNWKAKYSFTDLIKEMVDYDLELAQKEATCKF